MPVPTVPKSNHLSANESTLKRRFGATVRRYRHRLGISQEELAWRAEMHRTYLADVERGVRNLSLSSITRLVDAIDIPLSSFFATLESIEMPVATVNGRKKTVAKTRRR
jgi:transcriptional regulator with XRE-family HTH domain